MKLRCVQNEMWKLRDFKGSALFHWVQESVVFCPFWQCELRPIKQGDPLCVLTSVKFLSDEDDWELHKIYNSIITSNNEISGREMEK